MRIAILVDSKIGSGGGFNQALNAVLQMQRISSSDRFSFEVMTTQEENISYLHSLGVTATKVKVSFFDKLLCKLYQSSVWHQFQSRVKIIGPLEKKLIKNRFDLVYFVEPSPIALALQKLNYITTLWDLCHRESVEFPEVRNFNEYTVRENIYKNILSSALLILADSDQLAQMASNCYGILRTRFLEMPFLPSPFMGRGTGYQDDRLLSGNNITAGYFFYPAQFWPHKNHIRVLQALLVIKSQGGILPHVVFTGAANKHREYIERFICQNKLEQQVLILGFVSHENMEALYRGCIAVVMPTYFGPTNLPPLEAWMFGKPLIYSKTLMEQAGNAALLVDPNDATDLANKMQLCLDEKIRTKLIEEGGKRLQEISTRRETAEKYLSATLEKFSLMRECWE